MQRFTVAFNFLSVLLSLLYDGRHLSLSVRRKITVNVFIQRLQSFIYFCHFLRFLFFVERFFIYDSSHNNSTNETQKRMHTVEKRKI